MGIQEPRHRRPTTWFGREADERHHSVRSQARCSNGIGGAIARFRGAHFAPLGARRAFICSAMLRTPRATGRPSGKRGRDEAPKRKLRTHRQAGAAYIRYVDMSQCLAHGGMAPQLAFRFTTEIDLCPSQMRRRRKPWRYWTRCALPLLGTRASELESATKLANSSGASVGREREDAPMSKSSRDQCEERGDAVNVRGTLN